MSVQTTQFSSYEDPTVEGNLASHYKRIAESLVMAARQECGVQIDDRNRARFKIINSDTLVVWNAGMGPLWIGQFDPEAPYTILETVNRWLCSVESDWRIKCDHAADPYRIDIRFQFGRKHDVPDVDLA